MASARYAAKLAIARAHVTLAPYAAKAEIEWDMKWTSPLDKTLRDEMLVIIWAVPLLGLFIPGVNQYVIQGFDALKALDPNAPSLFMWGWAIIFGATFGIKRFNNLLMPSRYANLVRAMGSVRDDVPMDAMETAQDAENPTFNYQGEKQE